MREIHYFMELWTRQQEHRKKEEWACLKCGAIENCWHLSDLLKWEMRFLKDWGKRQGYGEASLLEMTDCGAYLET